MKEGKFKSKQGRTMGWAAPPPYAYYDLIMFISV